MPHLSGNKEGNDKRDDKRNEITAARLFVAIQLSEELKEEIAGRMREMKKLGIKGSYVPADNLHITLAFIGETTQTDTIRKALSEVHMEPFKLSLSETGSFGNILWIGADGDHELFEAAKNVRDALDRAGVSYDRKKFVPHITIIRRVSGSRKQVQAPGKTMTVRRISLMKSEAEDGRRVYTELYGINLS